MWNRCSLNERIQQDPALLSPALENELSGRILRILNLDRETPVMTCPRGTYSMALECYLILYQQGFVFFKVNIAAYCYPILVKIFVTYVYKPDPLRAMQYHQHNHAHLWIGILQFSQQTIHINWDLYRFVSSYLSAYHFSLAKTRL